jgi:hypothetical protein
MRIRQISFRGTPPQSPGRKLIYKIYCIAMRASLDIAHFQKEKEG